LYFKFLRKMILSAKHFAIFVILISITMNTSADNYLPDNKNLKLRFTCKILDQIGLSIKDGVSKRLHRKTGEERYGDDFWIHITYSEHDYYGYTLQINANSLRPLFNLTIKSENFNEPESSNESLMWNYMVGTPVMSVASSEMNANIINFSDVDAQITGRRYYKNDWNIVIRDGTFDEVLVSTANCMGVPDTFGVLLKRLMARHPFIL